MTNSLKLLMLAICFTSITIAKATDVNMSNANIAVTSDINFYDNGGPSAKYSANQNLTLTFTPSVGNRIKANFTAIELEDTDHLCVYNGSTATPSALIADIHWVNTVPPSLVNLISSAADGALTFVFTSDTSTEYLGWVSTITLEPIYNDDLKTISMSYTEPNPIIGRPYNYSAQIYNIGLKTALGTAYSVNFIDASNNVLATAPGVDIAPNTTKDFTVSIILNSAVNLRAQIVFAADQNSLNNTTLAQTVTPVNFILMKNATITIDSPLGFYDDGGASNNYSNGVTYTLTLLPNIATEKIKVEFTSFSLESSDKLTIYNGEIGSSNIIGTFSQSSLPAALQSITASHANGSLIFKFESNLSSAYSGWAATVSSVTPAPPTIIYVKPNSGSTAWNGKTPQYSNLTTALSNATSGSQIWVAAGTYTPTTSSDRDISFILKSGVSLYGGFAGTETDIAQRNWTLNQTILSGDINTTGNNSDNSYHIVECSGSYSAPIPNNFVVDGFYFQGGYADNATNLNNAGGALFLYAASPTINNCHFSNNYASQNGGAIYVNECHPIVTNSIFTKNTSGNTGGAAFYMKSDASFINCTFYDNDAIVQVQADAISVEQATSGFTTTVKNCIILNPTENGNLTYGAVISNSCIANIVNFNGNISDNPLFTDAANGDFTLQSTSPCVNAGSNAAIKSWMTTDFYNNIRIFNTTVDIGAFESQVITAIEEKATQSKGFSLSKNPIAKNEKITVELNNIDAGKISIINLSGVVLIEKEIENNPVMTITTNALPSGIYFIQLASQGINLSKQLIIK